MRYRKDDNYFVRIILRNLALFLAGALLGCLLLRFWELSAALSPSFFQDPPDFGSVFSGNLRFLMVLFLLSFLPAGALLVPLTFGIEGALLGMTVGLISASMGLHGAIGLIISIIFRLILVFPFSFLLGSWAVEQSLHFGHTKRGQPLKILFALFAVAALSAVLELIIGRQLGSIYYLSFGV